MLAMIRRISVCHSAVLAVMMALIAGGSAAEQNAVPVANLRDYAIPAQALDAALNAYIKTSGAQVFYETLLTMGRRSSDLAGRFTPETALPILLSGTGLVAYRTDVDAFVITPSSSHQAGPAASTTRPDGRFMAALQSGVLEALCRTPVTRPGGYKIAIELWIAPSGAVQRSALIGSTGDTQRDQMLLGALRGASISMAPPAGFPQPFILAVGRRMPQETGDCSN